MDVASRRGVRVRLKEHDSESSTSLSACSEGRAIRDGFSPVLLFPLSGLTTRSGMRAAFIGAQAGRGSGRVGTVGTSERLRHPRQDRGAAVVVASRIWDRVPRGLHMKTKLSGILVAAWGWYPVKSPAVR